MYNHNTDAATLDARKGPATVVPAMGFVEADYATAYAKDLFKRLTGYPAADRHDGDPGARWGRKVGTAADHALAYAKDLFKRLRVHPADDCRDHGHRVATFGRMAGTGEDPAMAYAKDLFKRLTGFPGTAGASVKRSFPISNAIGHAVARLARRIRTSLLEPYARGRRRRIAIAKLEALDDRLLADIGLNRGEIELVVDGKLARRRVVFSPPVTLSRPAEDRWHDLPLAA